jgi:hypothetical protein
MIRRITSCLFFLLVTGSALIAQAPKPNLFQLRINDDSKVWALCGEPGYTYFQDSSGFANWVHKGICDQFETEYDTVVTATEIIFPPKQIFIPFPVSQKFKFQKVKNQLYVKWWNGLRYQTNLYCNLDKSITITSFNLFTSLHDSGNLKVQIIKDSIIRFNEFRFDSYVVKTYQEFPSGVFTRFIYLDKKTLLPIYYSGINKRYGSHGGVETFSYRLSALMSIDNTLLKTWTGNLVQ